MSWLKRAFYQFKVDEIMERLDTFTPAKAEELMRALFQNRARLAFIDESMWDAIENKYHGKFGLFQPDPADIDMLAKVSAEEKNTESAKWGRALVEKYRPH